MDSTPQPHNQRAAATWSSGGDAYNEVSHQIASALDHCVLRLAPKPGERVLDLATGTGWTSRLIARCGAHVTGADIAADMLAAAKARATQENLAIHYDIGDAEKLPYDDGAFDAVSSTFGVMFVSHPEDAAREIARVCRKGGRMALATWTPNGSVREMFEIMRPYMPPPPNPAPPSPFAWGEPSRIKELFGDAFDLGFEEGTTIYYDRDGAAAWRAFVTGYGPTKMLAAGLEGEKRAALERDFTAYHDRFRTALGIALPRQYLLTAGHRR